MGKKLQGARLRAKKRAREALDELQASQADVAVVSDAVFVLDRDGAANKPSKRQVVKETKKPNNTSLSEHEQAQVDRLIKTHTKDDLVKLAEEGRKKLTAKRNPFRATKTAKAGKFDLWDSTTKPSSSRREKIAGIAPEHTKIVVKPKPPIIPAAVVAMAGQSYIPDADAHSKVIQVAAAIEMKREKAIQNEKDPISNGFSKETAALLLQGDTDEESDDDDSLPDEPVGAIPKRAHKLTRAQRNKQKRVRAQQAELSKQRMERKLIKQIGEIPVIRKELKQLERAAQETTHVDKKRKREDHPVDTPAIPVPLQSAGSLRSIKVMGSLTEERRNAMADRGLAEKPSFAHDAKRRRKLHRRKARKKVRDIRT